MADLRRHRILASDASAQRRGSAAPHAASVVRPLAGVGSLVVSASAVRSRLAAWAALHPEGRASAAASEWPAALLVATAVMESGRAALGSVAEALPWDRTITVPAAALDLQRRSALPAAVVRRALDALISAEVLDCRSRIGDELVVQFRSEVFEDAPVMATVAWDAVRDRLGSALSPATLLVLRELARRTMPEDRARAGMIPASLRDLEEATGSGKGATRTALGALGDAGLVESRMRPRVDSWHRLLPPAFGDAGEVGGSASSDLRSLSEREERPIGATSVAAQRERSVPDVTTASVPSARRVEKPRTPAPSGSGEIVATASPAPSAAPKQWAFVEVNGVRFPVPRGTTPQPEQDPDTREWFLRVGPNVRYGPLRFF